MNRDDFIIPEEDGKPIIHKEMYQFDESLYPLIYKKFNVNENALIQFNLNPTEHYDDLIECLGNDPSPEKVALFLFFSETSPHSLSILFFKENLFSDSFPFIFFRSPVISMLSFYDSAKILLTRVAIPYSESSFLLYVNTIGQVLQEHSYFKGISLRGISALLICIIILLWNIFLEEPLSQSMFLKLCNTNSVCSVFGDYALKCFYSQFSANPLHLSYSFLDTKYQPSKLMSGSIQMKGLIKKMKEVYASLNDDQLLFYSDESKKVIVGGLTVTQAFFATSSSKNKLNTFELESVNGEPFSYKNDSGKVVNSDKNSYAFKCSSKEDVENWRSSIVQLPFTLMLNHALQCQRDE